MNSLESLYPFMLNASADATYLLSEQNRIVYANDAACASLEYSREELLGQSIFDIAPHLTEAQLIKFRGLSGPPTNRPAQFQTRHLGKSGRIIDVSITSTAFLHGDAFFHVCIAKDITGQKQAAHEHALLKFAFDHNNVCVFLVEESGGFRYVNNALCELLGYTQAELLSMHIFAVNPDVPLQDWPGHWQALKEAGSFTFKSRNRTRNGKFIPVEIRANYFEFDGKEYNIGFIQDITDIHRTQEMLNEAQRIAMLGSWDWDVVTNRVAWSEMAYQIYTPDARPADPSFEEFKQSVHPDDLVRVVAAVQSAFAHDTPFDLDHRIVSVANGVRTVHAQGKVFRDADRKPVRMVGTVQDITERKRMEILVQQERATLRAFFDAMPNLAWMKDTEGRYLACNPRFEQFFGATEAEILGKSDFDFVDAELAAFFRRKDKEAEAAGKPCVNEEWVNFASDGRRALLEATKAPVSNAEGKIIGIIGISQDITERHRMQADLLRREQEFRSLAENLPDNIARWDTQGRYLFANNLLAKMFGIPVEQLLGKSAYELFPDDQFAEVGLAIFRVIETGQSQAIRKLSFRTGDGELRHDDLTFMPEFDSDGRLLSILSIGRNMTEHYKMQEEIAKKEALYRFLAENIPANIILWDQEARFLYVNSLYAEQSAKKPIDELIGKTVSEAFPHERFNATLEVVVRQVVHSKETISLKKLHIPMQDGSIQLHDIQLIPQLDQDGSVQGVLGVGFDMTAHYRLQDEIKAKEEQLRFTIETLPGAVGIFHLGLNMRASIPYMSPHSLELFGIDHETIMKDARTLLGLIHRDDRHKVRQGMMQSLQGMSPWREEYRINHPTKKERWLESQATPARHPEGGVQWYGYVHDITERKKFEKQAGLASIGQLSAGITHEINTPLTYIKGRLELISYSVDDLPEGSVKSEFLKNLISIQDGVLRMSRIIQSMREIAGKSKGAKETVDIYDSFIVTLTMIHNRAKYISAIHLNGAPFSLELQNRDKPCLAFVEKQRIEQVWIIILNNALDALEQNRRFDESLIDISVEESVDGIRIRIEDNAGGIPVDLLPVIFEPFTSTKAHGGMGLGLNIARRIIDEQGGSINVRNSGNGAVFALTLPASQENNTNSAG